MSAPVVWVVSPFSDPSPEAEFDRYRFICAELTRRGARVCQFVSSFDHGRKRQRTGHPSPWRVVPVPEPGYSRNVSFRRLASHLVFDALVILYFLREMFRGGRPDVILSAVPHNGAACVAGALARIAGARFVVDVHDTWPESLLGVTRLSAGSRTSPGGYTDPQANTGQFEVNDHRSPAEVTAVIRARGLDPVWKDWDDALWARKKD